MSASSLQGVCEVEELPEVQQLLQFISHDFLAHLPRVYDFHMNHLVQFSGTSGVQESGSSWASMGAQSVTRYQEQSYSVLFMQLVLSSFLILESITKEKQFDRVVTRDQTAAILGCLSQVVRIMASKGEAGVDLQAGSDP